MLFDNVVKQTGGGAKIRVSSLSDLVILHPNREDRRDPDDLISGVTTRPNPGGSLVEGIVVLTLPNAKKVDRLRVELVGKQSVWIKPAFETYEVMHQLAKLDTGPQTLCPGEHSFKFTFVVPDDSAAFENCLYGRTYHRLIATAEGLGKFGTDLVAESVLYVISNHSESGGIPPGFSMESESEHPVLGPVGATLSSKYLLVSGYLRLSLIMPSLAQEVEINDVRVNLVQHFTLCSLKKGRPESGKNEIKPITVLLWSMQKHSHQQTPIRLNTYEELSVIEQFRLPDDDKIRPSTAEGAITGISVQHELSVCIYYTPLHDNPERLRREKKLSTPATLSSCCCIFDALQLPAYSSGEQTNEAAYLDRDAIAFCTGCLCRMSDSINFSTYGFTSEEIDTALRGKLRQPAWKDDEAYVQEWQAHHAGPSRGITTNATGSAGSSSGLSSSPGSPRAPLSPRIHTGGIPLSQDRERSHQDQPPAARAWQIRPPLRTRNSGNSTHRLRD